MSTVTLSRVEIERRLLPPVCILTGEPTANTQLENFRWIPEWVPGTTAAISGLYLFVRYLFSLAGTDPPICLVGFFTIPTLIVFGGMLKMQWVAVNVPVVRRKYWNWLVRRFGSLIGGLLGMALMIIGFTNSNDLNGWKSEPDYGMWACRLGVLTLLAVGITSHIVHRSTVFALAITPTEMTLVNVHPNFDLHLAVERQLEAQRERERLIARVAWQNERDAAEFAGWGTGYPRAIRLQPEAIPDDAEVDERALLKIAQEELRTKPPETEDHGPARETDSI